MKNVPSLIDDTGKLRDSKKYAAFFRKPLSFYYHNVRSIKSSYKFSELKAHLSLRAIPIDVIVLTGTWLSEGNEQSSTSIDDYTVGQAEKNFNF